MKLPATLNVLSSEANSMLEQAKTYRGQMEALPEGDPRRGVYEQMIRDLLERSNRLSNAVKSSAASS